MGFIKKIAKGSLSGITQNASSIVGAKLGEAVAARIPQGTPPTPGQIQPQTSQQTVSPGPAHGQPQRVQSEGAVESALAGLLNSAERLIDNAGQLIGICPSCQTAAPANTACETCGTHVPPSPRQNQETGAPVQTAPAPGPRNCGNCGASIVGAFCEYCGAKTQ